MIPELDNSQAIEKLDAQKPLGERLMGEKELQAFLPAEKDLSLIHEAKPSQPEDSPFDIRRKAIGAKLSPIAYIASSAYHVITGLGLATGFVESDSSFVKNATRFTKIINSLVYGDLAIDAWKGKHTFDFISKILEPTLNCFSQLSNYHLLRGLGSAMTQLHLVNIPHIDKNNGHWENFIANLQETKRFFTEAWTTSFAGPNRRIFRGKADKGHTMALLSHIQGLSGILGLLNGSRRNLIDKIAGTTRNVVGTLVDLDLMCKKDDDERRTGQYYFAHAIFDTLKRFTTKERADIIDNLINPQRMANR